MVSELERECPVCEADRVFRRTASTNLHLGVKTKWACSECGYRFVMVNDEIDTMAES